MKKLTKENWLELAFFAFILLIWLAWAWILPFNEGPDEYMRSRIVDYIVEYGKLPTGYQQEIMDYSWGFTYGFRPILPQMVEAVFVRVAMIWTKDAFSLIFAGRLVSVVCGMIFAGFVRAISKKLFDRTDTQWLFTLLTVCLPQACFLFTYLNCDSMALMASAMILWYLIRGMEERFPFKNCVWIAVSCAICALSYYNAYGFLITAALIYLGCYLEWSREAADPEQRKEIWKSFWKKGLLILGIVLILAGWWFVRNYFLYDGDILGLKTQDQYAEHYAMDILKPSNRRTYQNQGYSMVYMLFRSDWAASVLKSFIGVLGPLWYALRWWMYVGYALLFIAGILGMLLECAAKFRGRKKGVSVNPERLFWHLGLLVAILVPNVLNFWYSYATDYQPQGRYSMPMLIPFMYYMARGLHFWVKWLEQRIGAALRRALSVLVAMVCLWIAGCALFCVVKIMWPAYKDVEDKSVVKVYTMEELYGDDWEEKMNN
ncbi:DUF2142 domain-containing protein [Anaerosacchariphilus sp. NSJ-68]|uniref:DUF2142 domain-containing protein n=2 Tax=Lachnospiraceae TaxID=186803 RepID=A0A923L965_9FIRM|nr:MULTISPECIES: DUF2142 domain-containing protein [Lachnospiraceae]MBC5658230.1 DUF2142 domain-containing protein [Anaerosacchariphilus hominis]MBC5698563.1 DUF2142 domain-containing protein [Roseburia difficilis]